MVELHLLNAIIPPRKVRALTDFRRSSMSMLRIRFAEQNTAGRFAYKQPQARKLALVLNRKVTGRA
jgi:hypothetical protein